MYNIHPDNLAFQEVLNQTPHPMLVVDADSRVVAVNPAAVVAYGYDREAFVGMTVSDITDTSEHQRLKACVGSGDASVRSSGRWKHVRRDGSPLVVDVTSYGLRFDGRPVRVVLAVDVTEQVTAEERTHQYIARLEAALGASVNALSFMTELRDPYTAGHQERVSRLAVALAAELQMDEEAREGIRIMGLVHDIGKIGNPVDILSTPRALSMAEYQMVKSHAQFGYDILARLDFGWPVAECVLQHHERLDGSGYPNGLKASDIRLESRIVAVADVIESMTSHRPYRSGVGAQKALDEVRFKPALYDPRVAEAAARVLRRGYTLQ